MELGPGAESWPLAGALTFVPAGQRCPLVQRVCQGFSLSLAGIHGIAHWLRVRENGLRLAGLTGADPAVVELFALFHDSQRQTDGLDPGHGGRAAEFLVTLRKPLGFLAGADFERLLFACAHHTAGWTEADLTVQACWDADRLDLGRVGIRPLPERLCTPAARDPDLLEWAYVRSRVRTGRAEQRTGDGEQR
jgi:uncharacterized protein